MANSLVKLTLESNQYERGIRQAKKAWKDFTDGIGLSVGKFTAVGAAIGAVTGALKVAKDAFFNNEQQLDEWNRTVEASKSVYNGFLNAINTGDISGYLSNISKITEAARAAYNALDELSTFNAFNQVNIERTRTGMTEAIAGFRSGETSKENVKAAAEAYKKELLARQEKEAEAYSQAIRKVAAERGVPWGNLEQALSGSYGSYQKLKETMPTGKRTAYMATGAWGTTMSYEVPMAVTAEEKMGEALRKLNDTELQNLQALGAQAERTGNEIAQVDKTIARLLNTKTTTGTSGGGGGRVGRVKTTNNEISTDEKIRQQWDKAMMQANVDANNMKVPEPSGPSEAWKAWVESVTAENEKAKSSIFDLINAFEKLNESEGVTDLKKLETDAKQTGMGFASAAAAISSVGSALQSLEDPGAKIAGIIGQAVAQIALGFAQATTAAAGGGPFAWIAAIAGGLGTMVSTIAAIHSATGFSEGGVVKGNTFSGDQIPAMLNAGEVVLTRAQAGVLASNLQGGGLQNLHLTATISGTQLRFVLNNESQARGRGQYVTTNFG